MNGDSKNNEKDASKGIDTMQYIVARLISEADDSLKDSREDPQNEFLSGRRSLTDQDKRPRYRPS